ncbi:hypothetical protein ACFSTC_00900 [Nonomuraea ferruginea]
MLATKLTEGAYLALAAGVLLWSLMRGIRSALRRARHRTRRHRPDRGVRRPPRGSSPWSWFPGWTRRPCAPWATPVRSGPTTWRRSRWPSTARTPRTC